jgi:hypothetical protein
VLSTDVRKNLDLCFFFVKKFIVHKKLQQKKNNENEKSERERRFMSLHSKKREDVYA